MITIVISTLLAWSRKIVVGSCLWKGQDLCTQKHVPGSLATFGKFGTAGQDSLYIGIYLSMNRKR